MLWAWNVVFVCNTESIFLCASRPQRLSPPATHYHFNHCPGKRHIIHAECHTRWIITAKRHKLTFQRVELNISLVTKVFTNVSKFPDVAKLIFLARETDRHIDILLTTIRNNNCKLKQYSGRLQERILQHIYDYYKQIEHEYSTENLVVYAVWKTNQQQNWRLVWRTAGYCCTDDIYRTTLGQRGICYGPVSVTSRNSIETAERIELVFGLGASFNPSYTEL